ncbi:importin-9-like [Dorcoceras hygrometricum]|uniref:Importin-9-like n=1 Tax=Dorcoceras hygrometricum TaxID=472368 RepID=A0A2Z7A5H5_9LAMI|nr:importin-9-like [Dorcoceras hygrometricum]
MDSDLVIYRTTLVRTFQVVTICRVDKSEVLVVLKGPYCTLTTTNWFLQELSVIPRESWGDVARRFIMIRWASPMGRFKPIIPILSLDLGHLKRDLLTTLASKLQKPPPLLSNLTHSRRPPPPTAVPPPSVCRVIGLVSITMTRRFHPWKNPSDLLVQIDGGRLIGLVWVSQSPTSSPLAEKIHETIRTMVQLHESCMDP